MPEDTFTDPWLAAPDPITGLVPRVRAAAPIAVYRLNATEQDGDTDPGDVSPTLLPNVVCEEIDQREGPYPRTAIFRYRFTGIDTDSPQSIEEALSTAVTTADLPNLIEIGDRLGVLATRPDGSTQWIFSGSPLTWTFALAADRESVFLVAAGDEKRLWDTPIPGAIYRGSADPEDTSADTPTDIRLVFNPRGRPNATPGTADSGADPYMYPVTMDPTVSGEDADGDPYPRTFDLPMACAYLFYTCNADQTWVSHPDRAALEALLVAREPIEGTAFDPNDASTYTATAIAASDQPNTGRAWPQRVYDLIHEPGFGMAFDLSPTATTPQTAIRLFLRQAADPKPLFLQAPGADLDVSLSNLAEAHGGRDLSSVANQWTVFGAPAQYEVSLVLSPGFPSVTADAGAVDTFDISNPAFDETNRDKYRLWLFDEAGTGHYPNLTAPGTAAETTGTPTSLDAVFGAPDDTTDPPTPKYVARRRGPSGDLLARDADGKRLRAKLAISTDYAGTYPAVWDGTGTWQTVQGGWQLQRDRLGIWLSSKNPSAWTVGASTLAGIPYPAGNVNVVAAMAAPTMGNPTFFLRLTCVTESDQAVKSTAARLETSPIGDVIERHVDARDRLFLKVISANSEHNPTASAVTVHDDTPYAQAEAIAYRTASDSGVFEFEAVIRRFTDAYEIGDRIDQIEGRNLGLRTDSGGTDYAPVLPVVVGRRWVLGSTQETHLSLSDSGVSRRRFGIKPRAAADAVPSSVRRWADRTLGRGRGSTA